jgi:hypothetical protein
VGFFFLKLKYFIVTAEDHLRGVTKMMHLADIFDVSDIFMQLRLRIEGLER